MLLTYVLSYCTSHFSLQFPQPHSPMTEVHQSTGVAFFKDHPWLHSVDLDAWIREDPCLMEVGRQIEESDSDPLTGTENVYFIYIWYYVIVVLHVTSYPTSLIQGGGVLIYRLQHNAQHMCNLSQVKCGTLHS